VKRKPLAPLVAAGYRMVLRAHLRSYETYQPVLGFERARAARDCEERWRAVAAALRAHDCESMADLGCSEGHYVLQAARSGLTFCLGVDFDLRRVFTCQSQVVLEDVRNAAFLVSEITPALADALPQVDAVVFLSVLHHIMAAEGEAHCRDLLRRIRAKTRKVMLFEMGQSDERSERWAPRLPDMGADPHAWIADFLRSSGFASVEKVAEARSYGREVQRALFAALP
jgi:hypothetical protein